MKQKLLAAFVFIIFSAFVQNKNDEIEAILWDCLADRFKENQIDLSKKLENIENHLVALNVLKSSSGQSYFEFLKQVEELNDFPSGLYHEEFENIFKLGPTDLYNARCLEKLKTIDSVIFFSSKYYQLTEAFRQVAYHELSPGSVAKSITSILCPNDFAYPYYRAATLLTIVFVAQLDIRYNHPIETTPIEDLFDYQSITFAVTEKNQIIIEGETVSNQELKTILMDFIRKNESNHIILFQSDRGTSYAFYVEVHNQITSAYKDLRDEMAKDLFEKTYDELTEKQKKEIAEIYPIRIKE